MERFENFVGIISAIYRDIQRIKSRRMQEFGLSGAHLMCMFALSQSEEGCTAAQLSRTVHIDKAAISRVLAELSQSGYLCYPALSEGKKYRAAAVLTPKGMEAMGRIDQIICEAVEAIGFGIEEADRAAMYRGLNAIAENLKRMARQKDAHGAQPGEEKDR